VDGTDWFWPADETIPLHRSVPDDRVRLLAPFASGAIIVGWGNLTFIEGTL
jgi:hypothetical protein